MPDETKPLVGWRYVLSPQLLSMCIIAFVMACVWWQLGYQLREDPQFVIWDDQKVTFLRNIPTMLDPYTRIPGFVNPPWTLVLLTPLRYIPRDVAIFLQIVIYFVTLAMLLRKFGGGVVSALILFTSPLAPDAVMNLNIDWLIVIGLLVPRAWSAPLILVKPQIATGYILSFDRRDFVRWVILALVITLLSFLIWGWWIPDWLTKLEVSPVTWLINLAPRALIGVVPSIVVGLIVAFFAVRRKDAVLGILAGLFFVPYVASYSWFIPFALIVTRSRIITFAMSVTVWILLIMVILQTPT